MAVSTPLTLWPWRLTLPWVRWYPQFFFMKMTAKDVKEIIYMPLVTFFSVLEQPGKTIRGVATTPPLVRRGLNRWPVWSRRLFPLDTKWCAPYRNKTVSKASSLGPLTLLFRWRSAPASINTTQVSILLCFDKSYCRQAMCKAVSPFCRKKYIDEW